MDTKLEGGRSIEQNNIQMATALLCQHVFLCIVAALEHHSPPTDENDDTIRLVFDWTSHTLRIALRLSLRTSIGVTGLARLRVKTLL